MKTVCCECKKVTTPGPDDKVSHGICTDCMPDVLKRGGMGVNEIKETMKSLEEDENEDK